MIEHGADLVAGRDEITYHSFSSSIVVDGDHDIDVASSPRFCASPHCETTDQCPRNLQSIEISRDAT